MRCAVPLPISQEGKRKSIDRVDLLLLTPRTLSLNVSLVSLGIEHVDEIELGKREDVLDVTLIQSRVHVHID